MEALLAKLAADSPASAAAIGVVVLAITDFVLGSLRAIAGGTFVWESFSTWVRAQLAGHVLPIFFLLLVGQVFGTIAIGDIRFNAILIGAELAAASYAATTVKSILDSINTNAPDPVPPPAT